MSRHIVIDRPNLQVVLGFDHPLRSFFGQAFDPSDPRLEGLAFNGWPTPSGLGLRRPVQTHAEAEADVGLLIHWIFDQDWVQGPSLIWAAHVERVRATLLWEWENGTDAPSPKIPAILMGEPDTIGPKPADAQVVRS
ncbi:hypothetical protein [Methylobacterium gossipiicola]|uniref:Uncharacterized protein n=1 Tax=Methylobacterium gossipiicola TaxID=582675 RepID=A0A1I2VTN4_9HYPH|nr:hypothetical protein [Methylobacterium gossipiicola]SFG92588.1 hypothetical protein SAMN05192565_11771 [Methylobacterium gossipiicola]